jgi:heme/copper-type cytochrome/quinol oxidase subunit 1
MPTITRTLIKTALAYMVAGTLLSALWLLQIAWPLHPLLAYLQPTALHLIVVGWLTQLIFGVALWMFPVWSKAEPRGPEQLNWLCYALLNGGLLLRLIAEPFNTYQPAALFGWMLVLSAALQALAVWLFVGLVWSRVRAKHAGRA